MTRGYSRRDALKTASAGVMGATAGCLGILNENENGEAQDKSVEPQLRYRTETDAKRLENITKQIDSEVIQVSDHPALGSEKSNEERQDYIDRILEKQLSDRATAVHLVQISNEETIVASTDENRVGENARETSWGPLVGGVDTDTARSSDPFTNPDGEKVMVAVSLATTNLGLLVGIEYAMGDISESFSSDIEGVFTDVVKPTPGETQVLFADREDTERNEPHVEEKSAHDIPELTATDEVRFTDNPTKTKTLDKEYVAAYTTVAETDWSVIKHAPEASDPVGSRAQLLFEAKRGAESVSQLFERMKPIVRMLSADPRHDNEPSAVSELLDRQKEMLSKQLHEILLVDTENEQIVASADDDRVGESVSETPWIKQTAFRGYSEVIASEPYRNSNGKMVLAFMSPVPETRGQVLVGTVDATRISFETAIDGTFTEVVRPVLGDEKTSILFSDSPHRDTVLSPYIEGESHREIPELRAALDGNTGIREKGTISATVGREYVTSYAPVDGENDWVVIKHAPSEKI